MRRALALLAACCLALGLGSGVAERLPPRAGIAGVPGPALNAQGEDRESHRVGVGEGRPSKSRSWRPTPLAVVEVAAGLPAATPERALAQDRLPPRPLRHDVAAAPARGPPAA